MPTRRTILHVDMDAFFASVEQRDDPALRGRPVLVGGTGPRGVVAAASYEARRFGCHSAQPMAVALRRCPDAVVVPPRGRAYREASDHVFGLFHQVTPLVEPLSIDEAFLDVTGCERMAGSGRDIAERLRAGIQADLALTASVGIAPNKFLAKLASDMDKPDGLTEIPADAVDRILLPLPVRRIPGIGPAAGKRLEKMGIHTVGDLRAEGRDALVARLGVHGERLHELAHGRDARSVVPDSRAKSISQECTFDLDLADADEVRAVLVRHVESVARRVRRSGVRAAVVQIKVRYGAFETITRSRTLTTPTDETAVFLEAADRLFATWAEEGFRPVRLIGFGASRLLDPDSQMQLFHDADVERSRRLDQAVDSLTERFGHRAIGRAAGALREDGRADGFEHEEGLDRRES